MQAYVLPGRIWRPNPSYGRVAFPYIFQNRPDGARYAVAGHYSVVLHADEFVVWDLFETLKTQPGEELVEPKPRLKHTDADAAIMATLLLYEGGAP